ncbi:Na+/H+ antiporter NhaA [Clostridium folliculivorans]|uniref:Na(+)/H(+) antiporter NhaA n=1 Tax=Clostridium folliculivorans TaxID=2886038 RepID=A0A9W5XYD5_9CLOT|nr:Na+/H+ antiporter NhaA [Clostridium folliculivorans]GKU23210.1 Na(+)/H(+) antiporter NhaA [Clostridium folliculivorans]GKU29256.1 Na(+)/H(+) antiporter NhaA [Clostridium folliculivorans]
MKDKIKQKRLNPFLFFFESESSSGLILLFCAITAMIIANSGLAKSYEHILHTYITIGYHKFSLSMSVLHWVNDWVMTLFFLVVGMEIKRELVIGELKSIKKTILPISAAIGGMIVPAIIYAIFNYKQSTITGWGIPMATDIAFALGILSMVAKKAPKGIVLFLTVLAIVDDLGAIVVIAIFYTSKISWVALILGLVIFSALLIANKVGVKSKTLFIIGGVLLWISFLKSGIHATIAGVLLAMTLPVGKNEDEFKTSMLQSFEHILTPWSAFVVMPVFALANSGITLEIKSFSKLIFEPVSLGIIFGLFIGKQLGIFGVSWVLIKLKIAKLPSKVEMKHLYGASVLGGIGFTMSLFVSSLSFSDDTILSTAKISIMSGSILAGICGSMIFKLIERKTKNKHVG